MKNYRSFILSINNNFSRLHFYGKQVIYEAHDNGPSKHFPLMDRDVQAMTRIGLESAQPPLNLKGCM
jgi:hypothetical protein